MAVLVSYILSDLYIFHIVYKTIICPSTRLTTGIGAVRSLQVYDVQSALKRCLSHPAIEGQHVSRLAGERQREVQRVERTQVHGVSGEQ